MITNYFIFSLITTFSLIFCSEIEVYNQIDNYQENDKAKDILSQAMTLEISSNSDKILKNQVKEILDKL